jgi:hypothetical protein
MDIRDTRGFRISHESVRKILARDVGVDEKHPGKAPQVSSRRKGGKPGILPMRTLSAGLWPDALFAKGGEPLRSYRRYRPALLLALAVALAAAFPVFAAPREPYACRLHADARRQCAFGNCDHRRLHRLERECLRDGGRP